MAGNDNTSSNASTSRPPNNNNDNNMTKEQLLNEVTALRSEIAIMTTKAAAKAVKPDTPSYDGSKGTLRGFLIQLRAFHLFYAHELPSELDKVLHASRCLKGNHCLGLNQRYRITLITVDNPIVWKTTPERYFKA